MNTQHQLTNIKLNYGSKSLKYQQPHNTALIYMDLKKT